MMHNHIHTIPEGPLTLAQAYAYDPTRTTTLRNAFVRAMNKRFMELTSVIRKTVVDNDAFGLQLRTNQMTPGNFGQFDFPRSADKIEAFMGLTLPVC